MKRKFIDKLPENAVELENFPGHHITPEGIIYSTVQGHIRVRQFGRNSANYSTCAMRSVSGRVLQPFVHRLVAVQFVPGDSTQEVNHKDLNKRNNHADNLEWVTHAQNLQHARGLKSWKSSNPGKALTATNPETGEVFTFKNGKEAAQWVGNPHTAGNISKACRFGGLSYGFRWNFA